jgi:hypothetical protein
MKPVCQRAIGGEVVKLTIRVPALARGRGTEIAANDRDHAQMNAV